MPARPGDESPRSPGASPSWRPTARIRPGGLPAWVRWARHEEVDELEDLYRAVEDGEHEPTEVDELRCIEIAAGATRRMLAGEPPS